MEFAKQKGFDPLIPENWYKIKFREFIKEVRTRRKTKIENKNKNKNETKNETKPKTKPKT